MSRVTTIWFSSNSVRKKIVTYLELASDVGELLVDPLDLGLLALAVPDVGYEDREPSHAIATNSGHLYLFTQAERGKKREMLSCDHKMWPVPWSRPSHTLAFEELNIH